MDIKQQQLFYTLEQLEQLIEIPIKQVITCARGKEISEVEDCLVEYMNVKGLIKPANEGHTRPFYVDGIFQVTKTEMKLVGDLEDDESTIEAFRLLREIKGTKYYESNNVKIGCVYQAVTTIDVDEIGIMYSYDEFIHLINVLEIPLARTLPINKTKFNYDPALLNQKSNFTLEEASRIAANAPLENQQGVFYSTALVKHYQEIISECVKKQNQHNFHLITLELWVHSHDEYEPCSKRHGNGTQLRIGVDVDLELSVISKAEFLRWCKYMDIETGLYYEPQIITESVEALKLENERLKTDIEGLKSSNIKLSLPKPLPNPKMKTIYPQELQIAIDAYNTLIKGSETIPTNKVIKRWLDTQSKERGMKHNDSAKTTNGLSEKTKEIIAKIIKP